MYIWSVAHYNYYLLRTYVLYTVGTYNCNMVDYRNLKLAPEDGLTEILCALLMKCVWENVWSTHMCLFLKSSLMDHFTLQPHIHSGTLRLSNYPIQMGQSQFEA